jgi:hypothetical protein
MAEDLNTSEEIENISWRGLVGGALVVGGGFLLLDQLFHFGWMAPLSVLAAGLFILVGGLRNQSKGYLISGSLVLGLGAGIAGAFDFPAIQTISEKIGIIAVFTGVGFGLVEILLRRLFNTVVWWPVIPLAGLVSLGMCLLVTPAGILDLVLYMSLGLGLTFLGIGLANHWLGLIIPGCLVVSTGLGLYLSWGTSFGVNPLAKTGGMLVLFAFGWGLITVFSRMIIKKVVWWPLIPGGLLAVVGWGLYTGGDPGSAVQFISNTGTIAILILGFYLMMMRRGIR